MNRAGTQKFGLKTTTSPQNSLTFLKSSFICIYADKFVNYNLQFYTVCLNCSPIAFQWRTGDWMR